MPGGGGAGKKSKSVIDQDPVIWLSPSSQDSLLQCIFVPRYLFLLGLILEVFIPQIPKMKSTPLNNPLGMESTKLATSEQNALPSSIPKGKEENTWHQLFRTDELLQAWPQKKFGDNGVLFCNGCPSEN